MQVKKIYIFFLILAFLLVIITGCLYYKFSKLSKSEKQIANAPQAGTESVVFKNNLGRQMNLGIESKTDRVGNKYISLVGTLTKAYENSGRYYFDISTVNGNNTLNITVDLADSSYVFAEKTVILDKDSNDQTTGFAYSYKNSSSKVIFEKYKGLIDKVVLIELNLYIEEKVEKTPFPCSENCPTTHKSELQKYLESNTSLLNIITNKGQNVTSEFIVGSPRLISV